MIPEEALQPGSNLWYRPDHALRRVIKGKMRWLCCYDEVWEICGYERDLDLYGYQEVSLDFLLTEARLFGDPSSARQAVRNVLV